MTLLVLYRCSNTLRMEERAAHVLLLGRHGMTRLFRANSWRAATWMQNIVINDGEDVFNPHNAYAKYRHWNKRTIWSVLVHLYITSFQTEQKGALVVREAGGMLLTL